MDSFKLLAKTHGTGVETRQSGVQPNDSKVVTELDWGDHVNATVVKQLQHLTEIVTV